MPDLSQWQQFGLIGITTGCLLFVVLGVLYFAARQLIKAREFSEKTANDSIAREIRSREESRQREDAMEERHSKERKEIAERHSAERLEIIQKTNDAIEKNSEAVDRLGGHLLEGLREMSKRPAHE